MLRTCRLVVAQTRQAFLQQLTWRAFFITIALQHVVTPLLGLAVWSSARPGLQFILTYYVAALAVQMMTVSYEHHTLSNAIYTGVFTADLVKPVAPALATIGTSLALKAWHVMLALPIAAGLAVILRAPFRASDVALAVPALILASGLRFAFTYVLALSAFWSQQAQGLVALGDTMIFLLGGVAAPLTLFPSGLRALVEALPFGAMLGFPAEVASGTVKGSAVAAGYGLQVLWLTVLVGTAAALWRAGVRRYSAIGG